MKASIRSSKLSKSAMRAPCSDCGRPVKKQAITQEFEKEGVKVRVTGIRTWVCSGCGEVYFEPGGADQMARAVNALFALAGVEKQHKGTLAIELS